MNQTTSVDEVDVEMFEGNLTCNDKNNYVQVPPDHTHSNQFDPTNPNCRIAPWYGLLSIETQREGKEADFRTVLKRVDGTISGKVTRTLESTFLGVLSGEKIAGYRNKNKFTFGYSYDALNKSDVDNSYMKLGFIGGEHPETFVCDVADACTIDDTFKMIATRIESVVKQSAIKPFLQPPRTKKHRVPKEVLKTIPKHRGVWRYVVIRHSVFEDVYTVTMYNFVKNVTELNREEYDQILQKLNESLHGFQNVRSFNLVEFDKSFEPKPTDNVKVLFAKNGDNNIYEKIMGKTFRVSPDSFFQVNTETTEIMYSAVLESLHKLIQLTPTSETSTKIRRNILLDLYCGTGTIGLCMTDKDTNDLSSPLSIHNIVGVDIVDSCIQDARENALLNGQSNCTYITGRCEDQKTLDSLTGLINQNADRYDTKVYLIVDPARDGLHRKVRRFIKTFRFDGFIYCSKICIDLHIINKKLIQIHFAH